MNVTSSPEVASVVAAARPGKSGQSVGHQAKAAVAAAASDGVDLPRNAQGMAASAIARGIDPASVFAALVAPEPTPPTGDGAVDEPPVPTGEPDGAVTDPTETPADDPVVATDGDAVPGGVDGGAGTAAGEISGAETALALLQREEPV